MQSPVILIGMHRSGTTMIADLLRQLGLHLGWLLQENSEAVFFVERNERLMNVCGGGWEQPEPVENLLDDPGMRQVVRDELLRDMESLRFASFLGPTRWRCLGSLKRLDFPWGWKDPRNTFLLPLWLDLFPDARIVHIYRHPMDVALSLQRRETSRIARVLDMSKGRGTAEGTEKWRSTGTAGTMLRLYRRFGGVMSRLSPLGKYGRYGVADTASLERGYRLWCRYVAKCCEHQAVLPNRFLNIRYESFLGGSADHLDELREFCGLPGGKDAVRRVCTTVRADRRFAFRTSAAACGLFRRVRGDEWVVRLGYADDATPDDDEVSPASDASRPSWERGVDVSGRSTAEDGAR